MAKAQAVMAGNDQTGRKQPRKSRKKAVWLIGLIGVPLFVTALPTTILLLIGLIPTIVAYMVDQTPQKYLPMTVGAVNLAGIVHPAFSLWLGSHTTEAAVAVATSPFNMAIMYSAAGVGWLIYFSVPPVIATLINLQNGSQVRSLEGKQRKMVEEWGPEVQQKDYDPLKHL